MATFLDTSGVSHYLEKLIKNTNTGLLLVSPYLQLSDRIKHSLDYLSHQKKKIQIIYRENKLQPSDKAWLEAHPEIVIKACKHLHAKCYINETEAILTSMNLYEFSQVNNYEMGVHLQKGQDIELYDEVRKEVMRIIYVSESVQLSGQPKKVKAKSQEHKNGFCIRTGVPIPFNLDKPLSFEAYKVWSDYMDEDYEEKFCHFSGEPSHGETSYAYPVLKKNWKKAQQVFNH